MYRNFDRKGFLALTGGTSLAAFLAACGGSSSDSADPTSAINDAQAEGIVAEETAAGGSFDPATEPDGPIEIFTWSGYDNDAENGAPWMYSQYEEGPYGKVSPPKFTFLDDDAQALSKAASGFQFDIAHPCISYVPQWQTAELIQPLDLSLLPDFDGIPEAITAGGVIDGKVYFMPFDVGFTSLTYDADAMDFDSTDGEESWRILLDERYKGKMSFFSDPVSIISISHQMNEGAVDPNVMDSAQVEAAKQTALQWKGNMRNYWSSEQEAINDFVNGNLIATYTWPNGYWAIKNHPKMKDRNIKYMQPREGRGAWVCGVVLSAGSERPGRSMLVMASLNTPQAAANLTDIYQYSSAQQKGVADLIQDKEIVKAFSIDDPTAWEPPKTWFEAPLSNFAEVRNAGEEVKNS
jgi:spermidine/putrescine transport system substrate-binding protein